MVNLADIAGAAGTVQVSSTNVTARVVWASVTGAGTVRLGDSTVAVNKGLALVAGAVPLQLPPMIDSGGSPVYSLAGLYAYIPAGATLQIAYEPF